MNDDSSLSFRLQGKTALVTGAARGITVNAIAPGIVATDLIFEIPGEAGAREFAKLSPLGFEMPADIAAAAIYLASEAGRHLTGAILDVNGGLYMR